MDHFEHIARASVDRLVEAMGLSPKNRAEAYDRLAIHLRAGFVDVYAVLARHDRRITELLEANNREVERRRAAEARIEQLARELAESRKSDGGPEF